MKRWWVALLGASTLLLQFDVVPSAMAETPPVFKVVVNSTNPVSSLTKTELTRLFLRRINRWEAGGKVEPVDLPISSPIRASFSSVVLNRRVEAIRSYWQKLVFSGRGVPPPEKPDSEAVLLFVAANRNAIGYVSAATDTTKVKVVTVKD